MKTNKHKAKIAIILIAALVSLYGLWPLVDTARAVDSIIHASDTLSDSDVGNPATHTIDFETIATTATAGYIDIVFHDDFGDVLVGNITCPANWTESAPNTETARCTADNDRAPAAYEVTVADVTNPAAEGDYSVYINQYSGGELIARVQLKVYVIEDVLMTARVEATLYFEITGTSTGITVNGVTCNATTTATTTPFGTLDHLTPKTVCQGLIVETNARDGFIVTVEQDGELESDNGANINSFRNSPDNTGSTTPQAWQEPTNILDQYHTYGHMGLTSNDADLSTVGSYNDFRGSLYVGFNSTDPVVVMHHTGPSDGSTPNVGTAAVAYTAEIGSLQEAGDYSSTLTYICTPTY